MKVTLRHYYTSYNVKLVPEAAPYDKEFEVELPIKEVQRIIELQTEMEELQQKLVPLFKACEELQKEAREIQRREEEDKRLAEAMEADMQDDASMLNITAQV